MNISIVGTGYVGLVTGICFAKLGHKVTCIDNDKDKIEKLNKGIIPIYEPGLKEILEQFKGNIKFMEDVKQGVKDSECIFIAVGTPPKESGDADLSAIENVTEQIAEIMNDYKLIVGKSTVPVQTGKRIKQVMNLRIKKGVPFDVASNPEFLREGSAVHDFLHPDRVVIGLDSKRAEKILTEIYKPLSAPIVVTDIESAEIIKHASNSLLATKISFINAVSVICELSGADIKKVSEGIGLDTRIGKTFLDAGIGFGGFCFPKDLRAFKHISEKLGYEFALLDDVEKINEDMKKRFVEKIEDVLWNLNGKTIGILGLSFKPNTDDMRYAPSIDIINRLQKEGAKIRAYDPQAMNKAKLILKKIQFCKDPYKVVENANCLALLTEWEEFRDIDLKKMYAIMKTPIIVDGRNLFDRQEVEKIGFIYRGIGR